MFGAVDAPCLMTVVSGWAALNGRGTWGGWAVMDGCDGVDVLGAMAFWNLFQAHDIGFTNLKHWIDSVVLTHTWKC